MVSSCRLRSNWVKHKDVLAVFRLLAADFAMVVLKIVTSDFAPTFLCDEQALNLSPDSFRSRANHNVENEVPVRDLRKRLLPI